MAITLSSRIGDRKINNQGYLMEIIKYNSAKNITVEFQDKYKAKVHTTYNHFLLGKVKNPYHTSVFGVGMIGVKYPVSINGKHTKEYIAWNSMLCRCFDNKFKNKNFAYTDVTCCEEWLLFENFYEWLHEQENFDKWLKNKHWDIDKDIVKKNNTLYSPNFCCLVPKNVNSLFLKCDAARGVLPIGVTNDAYGNGFRARCNNLIVGKRINLGCYSTPEKAFYVYKEYKEDLIKQVAKIEFNQGNITEACYNAMMDYKVEITD